MKNREKNTYYLWWYAPGEGRKWAVAADPASPHPQIFDRVYFEVPTKTQITAKGGKGVLVATGYLEVDDGGGELVARISDELDKDAKLLVSAADVRAGLTLAKVNELCQDAIAAERERIAKLLESSEPSTRFEKALKHLSENFNRLPDWLLDPLETLCRAGADDRRDLAAMIRSGRIG